LRLPEAAPTMTLGTQNGFEREPGDTVSDKRETGAAPLLEVRGLTKVFGQLRACDDIDLTIGKGEIHALLGENGAGKSTFVKMLFGSLEPASGDIQWNGEKVAIKSPGQARKLG